MPPSEAGDRRRCERYNMILNACKNQKKPKTCRELEEIIDKYSYEIITVDVKKMAEDGYLQAVPFKTEKWNQQSTKYYSLKVRYLLSDIIPASVLAQINKANRVNINIIQATQEKKPDYIRYIAERHTTRIKRKSITVYVGSSMVMI